MITMTYAGRINVYCGNSDDDIQNNEDYKVNVPNGSRFDEIDTSVEYRFDAEKREWIPQKKVEGDEGHGTYGNITLSPVWEGSDPYTQTVTISGYETTANTRVDLVQDSKVLDQMNEDGVTKIYIENDNNVFTAYAVGGKPTKVMAITTTFTEVN